MNPSDSSLPLEKIFAGALIFLAGLALLTLAITIFKLAKLMRGPGRPPHRACAAELDLPSGQISPSPSGPPPHDPAHPGPPQATLQDDVGKAAGG